MPETSVRYETRAGPVDLPIRFVGPEQNFVLKTEPISHRMSANIPPRMLDLLEIASAVFCADSTVSRGGLTQPRNGQTWRRRLDFTFAVRDIAFWQQSDISRLLSNTIEFMTDDKIECDFVEAERAPQAQSYLNFSAQPAAAFQIDDVVLFSGGVDSLAGVLQALATTERRVALVTHRSAPKTMRHQNDLIDRLGKTFGDRFLWIPVLVNRKGRRGTETTQRSRSLLFASLGCVVASMLKSNRIRFFENGIVSQNLPLARPIVGTLATRTTHPQSLHLLEQLLSQVNEAPMQVGNAFEWMTKTEVVRLLKEHGQSSLLPLTVSCNHTFKRKSDVRHCGSCTQCLDRRCAVLASGLGHLEREGDYATDVLFGTRERDDEQALAIEWVRHARRLSQMKAGEFRIRFMGDLLRIAHAFPDKEKAFELSHEMHSRHGRVVLEVLSGLSVAQVESAPPGSIAAQMGGSRSAPHIEQTIPTPDPAPAAREGKVSKDLDRPTLELMRLNTNNLCVLGLQDFSGVHARLISCLLDVFIEDRDAGHQLADYRCLKAREIADRMCVTEDYVRTEVKRIRQGLKESWAGIHDTDPPEQILIRTIGKNGYRLDPAINLVSPNKLP